MGRAAWRGTANGPDARGELISDHAHGEISPGELINAEAPPALALLDLSVADDRFSPLLLAATLAHIVEAWEEASDDSDGAMLTIATEQAVHSLCHPPAGSGRRFIRDAALEHWNVIRVDASCTPPNVVVAVNVTAAVYTSDGDSVSGSHRMSRELELTWTLDSTKARTTRPDGGSRQPPPADTRGGFAFRRRRDGRFLGRA